LEGATADRTAEGLRALATAGLLVESDRQGSRYRYHDLLREYARERTEREDSDADRRAAVRRLLRHYADTAGQADAALRGASGVDTTRFTGRASARRWFDIERPALVGAVQLGAASGFPAETAALAARLTAYFDLRKRWDEWTATHELASDCARQAGDRARMGFLLGHMGRAYAQQRRYDEALIAYGRSRAAYRLAGDSQGAHLVLGRMLRVLQDTRTRGVPLREAIRRYERVADSLSEADDDPATLADILNNLGNLRHTGGSYAEAAKCHERALRIRVGCGDRRGVAQSLVNFGNALRAANASQRAVEPYERAAQMFREIDDRYGQAQALENLGLAHLDSGQIRACRRAWRDAAARFTEAGHPAEAARLAGSIGSLRPWRRERAVPGLRRRAGTNYHVPHEGGDEPPGTANGTGTATGTGTGTGTTRNDRVRAGARRSAAGGTPASNGEPPESSGVGQSGPQDPGPESGAGASAHGTGDGAHTIDAMGGHPEEDTDEGKEDGAIDVDGTPAVQDYDDDQNGDMDDEQGSDWGDDQDD
jgi:tetratricopeptide (TPR) repeat protein